MDLIMLPYSVTAIRESERASSRKREDVSIERLGNSIADRL